MSYAAHRLTDGRQNNTNKWVLKKALKKKFQNPWKTLNEFQIKNSIYVCLKYKFIFISQLFHFINVLKSIFRMYNNVFLKISDNIA